MEEISFETLQESQLAEGASVYHRRILIGVDGGKACVNALTKVKDLVHGDETALVYCVRVVDYKSFPLANQQFQHVLKTDYQKRAKIAAQYLQHTILWLAKHGVTSTWHSLKHHHPGPALVEFAKKHGIDTIALGRSNTPPKMGSTTEYVLNNFPGSILIAKLEENNVTDELNGELSRSLSPITAESKFEARVPDSTDTTSTSTSSSTDTGTTASSATEPQQ